MITCLFGSSRIDGNSMIAIKCLMKGLEYDFVNLYSKNIKKVIDNRHNNSNANIPFSFHEDDYDSILESVISSDTIIFSTPLYWYSMSSALKLFIDRWTETLRDNKIKNFKEVMSKKKYIVVIIGGDEPETKSLPLVNQFKYIFEFMNVKNYQFIIGEAVKPFDILKDKTFLDELRKINTFLSTGKHND